MVYKGAVRLPESLDPAAGCSIAMGGPTLARRHLYVHYHSRIHEVLGIARGSGKVQFGGPKGRTLTVKAGDVAILPQYGPSMRVQAINALKPLKTFW